MLKSRGWFIMLTVSLLLIVSLVLAFSKFGHIKLGYDDDHPEFSTVTAIRQIIAMSAGPFVFIVLLLVVCLLKSLHNEASERRG